MHTIHWKFLKELNLYPVSIRSDSESLNFPWNRISAFPYQIRNYFLRVERAVKMTKSRQGQVFPCNHHPGKKPSTACVLSCVVGSGPPARTTSHCYLLVSVSLGGKSISFRRYCADLFVQAPKRSPHPYPVIPVQQKAEKECGDCWKRRKKRGSLY